MLGYYFNLIADLTFRQLLHSIAARIRRFDGIKEFNGVDRPCIFVLSTGRVGTKTLAALAGLSNHIVALHEPTPKLYGLSYLYYRHHLGNDNDEIFAEAFLTARRERFNYALLFGRGYVETSPQVTFLGPPIRMAVPQAKFIHVVRHPSTFVRSGMRRGWYSSHPMDNTRLKPLSHSKDYKYWKQWENVEKISWLWKETNTWINRFMQSLPINQRLLLHSEKILLNDRDEIKKLFDFLHSPVPDEKKIKKILSKRINAQTTGYFKEITEWSDELHAKINSIAGESAQQFGYI